MHVKRNKKKTDVKRLTKKYYNIFPHNLVHPAAARKPTKS